MCVCVCVCVCGTYWKYVDMFVCIHVDMSKCIKPVSLIKGVYVQNGLVREEGGGVVKDHTWSVLDEGRRRGMGEGEEGMGLTSRR